MFKLNKKGLLLASATTFLFACSATQTADPIVSQTDASQPTLIKANQSITNNTQSERLTLEQIMADQLTRADYYKATKHCPFPLY